MPLTSAPLLNRIVTLASPAQSVRVTRAPGIIIPSCLPDARSKEIAVISHELRNSLGVIRNAARLLQSSADERALEYARTLIERHARQMSRHIDELLETAQPRKKVLHLAYVDLRTIVDIAAKDLAPDMLRRGHQLEV